MKLSIFNVDPTTLTLSFPENWTLEQHGGWFTLECMTLSPHRPNDLPSREEITLFVENGEALARLALVLSEAADALLSEAHGKVRATVEARRDAAAASAPVEAS